jgi:hypothetical protein
MDHNTYFGDWYTTDSKDLAATFNTNKPYPCIVIDNFFNDTFIKQIASEFPPLSNPAWMKYHNPIEKKFALNDLAALPSTRSAFDLLQSDAFLEKMQSISQIHDLEIDPHLHGGGLHYHPRGGKLDMHLDYSIHPITGKERRLNLIVYLNHEWQSGWGGEIQLWDDDFQHCVQAFEPSWNRAVLFRTSDLSFHGLPNPIACPDDTGRKSLAIYYVSPPREGVTHRLKAEFRPLPGQPVPEALRALYDIRVNRRITDEDLETIYPGWETDEAGKGYWW